LAGAGAAAGVEIQSLCNGRTSRLRCAVPLLFIDGLVDARAEAEIEVSAVVPAE
jgi:hypothetical protein